ncbi:triacylglycerol lipase [Halalkalibacterium halodurans]|uniref:BH1896 protein n=1 Tax=Halalkalibacterium halodurans (strain ATCC BAA-125 / DSM 18197 / FERM 7344 / JCM 9153 / C-125) TaxID=272558 RepID=Q9KBN0_HALH5|nr:triacylglycerol lipase [Halalkalibacterium halodurans]MED4082659.1 triacylglycerol lipase [Halalkalibacterium halodurans]MED4087206.1 triacylglycerol lipase [Halalkalibacterium halodurans]MED4105957.1 triacylglycerol lipase [Halalkalibacterium halodurans]MED4111025.1 triacylglycerol lipase [Halalkalibacterium halodurans]MED4151193.1 triacylglycerol lipase [Halalkalibacterium halodurans]
MKKLVGLMMMMFLLIIPVDAFAGKFDPPGNPGHWYAGDDPGSIDPNKAPIVFVHGLNSSSHTWWDGNDMYDTARANGYQTAFVDLYPVKDMWDNGSMLATMLEEIYHHFGRKPLVLVTHSKGGVDSQTALVHYGAHPYVSNVITLSTPHHGSQLADLAYSSWAGWLAEIIGGRNDGTYSLQTGHMAYYRSLTDSHAHHRTNPIYTLAGTSWGSFGGSLYWGGLYLSQYGQNDGAVTVSSSRLPYARELAVSNWDHYNINNGRTTFQHFRSYLTPNRHTVSTMNAQAEVDQPLASATIFRGGEEQGEVKEVVTVEDGVQTITFDYLSDAPLQDVTVTAPNGDKYPLNQVVEVEGEFAGAWQHIATVTNPQVGEWTVTAKHVKTHPYLLTVQLEGGVTDQLEIEIPTVTNEKIKTKGAKINKQKLKYDVQVEYTNPANKTVTQKVKARVTKDGELYLPLNKEGSYTITLDVSGETTNKAPFERTIVKNVYVDKNGKLFQ